MAKRKQQPSSVAQSQTTTLTRIDVSNDNLFIEKRNALKEFSANLPQQTDLPTVPSEGWFFGLNDHTVTGQELNNLTENIQSRMIEQNKVLLDVIKEFHVIYDTFSALDKIYVQEIVITLNAALKANEKANKSLEKLSIQQDTIKDNQQDIRQLVERQKQTIQVLKNFHKKLAEEVRQTKQRFSEIVQETEVRYDKYAEKCNLIEATTDKQYETIQNELIVLRSEYTVLSKALILAKRISFASLACSLVLIILFLTGVLK